MIKDRIVIDMNADGTFTVCVDGGNLECPTREEVMAHVGSEMGMTYCKAQRQLLSRALEAENNLRKCEKDAEMITADRNKLLSQVLALREENEKLRSAIVDWFVRTFSKGDTE